VPDALFKTICPPADIVTIPEEKSWWEKLACFSDDGPEKGPRRTLKQRVKSFVELYLDFVADEARLFTLGRPVALQSLYLASPKDGGTDPSLLLELGQSSKKLVTMFLSMQEYPYIRYMDGSVLSKAFAKIVEDEMNNILRKETNTNFKKNRATLLILDRSFDVVTPLMHEFTYQCMVHEFLNVNGEVREQEKLRDREGGGGRRGGKYIRAYG
jgi:syntaxin-binding protein 1